MADAPEIRVFTQYDTLVSLYMHLQKADGSTPALEGEVLVFMKKKGAKPAAVPKINGEQASVVSAAARTVKYDWRDEDVTEIGDFNVWAVNVVGGRPEHFPGQGPLLIARFVRAEGRPIAGS